MFEILHLKYYIGLYNDMKISERPEFKSKKTTINFWGKRYRISSSQSYEK